MRLNKIKMLSILIIIMFIGVCIIPIINGNVKKLNTFSDVKNEFEDEVSKITFNADFNPYSFSNKGSKEVLVVDHSSVSEFNQIPEYWIDQAKSNLHIAYQHTSHGSQLVTGMNALEDFPAFGDKYEWTDDGSSGLDFDDYGIPGCADLSQGDYIDGNGVTPWVTSTRNLLNDPSNSHVNVIMWSWCSINGHNIARYLENMEILVSEYPNVDFVFMTGHAEGQGEGGFIHTANEQIRQHCIDNDRILFDFSDIENYDPDEIYYYNEPMWDDLDYNPGRTNNWGEEWIDDNTGSELEQLTTGNDVIDYEGCESCAHSNGPSNKARINCVLKGQGVWYLMAKLAGWNNTGDTLDIDQSIFDRGFPIRHAVDGDWAGAQSFTPTVDTITSVDVYLRKFGTPEFDLTVELRIDNPEGILHDIVVFTPAQIGTSFTWLSIDFIDTAVVPGTDYFIVIPPAPSGVTTSFGYEWGYAFGNQYNDGAFWFTRDGGVLWRDLPTMYEFSFRLYGC